MYDILNVINSYRILIGAIVLTLVLALLIRRYWEDIRFWWRCTWYRFPAIGKLARLSKNINTNKEGWFVSERQLCDDFLIERKRLVGDPKRYNKAASYLRKVQENGRTEMGFFSWAFVLVLVISEAAVFGYVLAGFVAPSASEAITIQGALAVGIMIASVLVFLTHISGHELHKRELIKKARAWWNASNPETRVNITTAHGNVDIDKNDDDAYPPYIQLLNRVKHRADATPGIPWITIVTAAIIIMIAVFATYVRIETQDTLIAQQAQEQSNATEEFVFGSSSLPSVVTDKQNEKVGALEQQINDSKRRGGYAAFIVLAILFVGIQLLGVMMGFKKSFVGAESKKASRLVRRFATSEEYEAWCEERLANISNIAQSLLGSLQSSLQSRAQDYGAEKGLKELANAANDRTFDGFLELKETQKHQKKILENARATEIPAASSKPADTESPEEMEARIRKELEKEMEQNAASQKPKRETEEEMRERLREDMAAKMASTPKSED